MVTLLILCYLLGAMGNAAVIGYTAHPALPPTYREKLLTLIWPIVIVLEIFNFLLWTPWFEMGQKVYKLVELVRKK